MNGVLGEVAACVCCAEGRHGSARKAGSCRQRQALHHASHCCAKPCRDCAAVHNRAAVPAALLAAISPDRATMMAAFWKLSS